jgi:quercetin dioxygenase-like cupin family protein
MRIVSGHSTSFEEKTHTPREGRFRFKRLLEGEPDTPGNFFLELVETSSDFYSPRHRHNFDQFRFQIEGTVDFGKDGSMPPGSVAYFPEGTRYGPQTLSGYSMTLVLQFGGASGNGYLNERQLTDAVAALKQTGTFKAGVYYPNEGSGGRQQDAFEACWEFHNNRKLVYPADRYQRPIFINSGNFPWCSVQAEPGVSIKELGRFTERRTGVEFLQLEPGAVHRRRGERIYYVLSGQGGGSGGAWRSESVLHTAPGEAHELIAQSPSELFIIVMPQSNAAVLAEAA